MDLFTTVQAQQLAESVAKDFKSMSPGQLRNVRQDAFNLLQQPNGTVGQTEIEAARAILISTSHYLSKDAPNVQDISRNSPEQLDIMHSNMVSNAEQELIEAKRGSSPSRVEQAERMLHNLNNVSLLQHEEQPLPYFANEAERQKYEENGRREVTIVKTSEQHLATPPVSQLTVADSRAAKTELQAAQAREAGRV